MNIIPTRKIPNTLEIFLKRHESAPKLLQTFQSPREKPRFFESKCPLNKNSFELPSLSTREKFCVKKKCPKLRSKSNNNTIHSATNSFIIHKSMEVDPEIIHEAPYKNQIISRYPNKKLKLFLDSCQSNKINLTRTVNKKNNSSPNLRSYLDFLEVSLKNNALDFSDKMYEKNEKPKDPEEANEPVSVLAEEEWFKQLSRRNTNSRSSVKSQRLGLYSKKSSISGVKIPSKKDSIANIQVSFEETPSFRLGFLKKSSVHSRGSSVNQKEHKRDDLKAKELADEITKNYKIFLASAGKNKEFQTKIQSFLERKDILETFIGKGSKVFSLQTRIYRDMIEIAENEWSPQRSSTRTSHNESQISFSHQIKSIEKRSRPQFKLTGNKYRIYQALNKELISLESQFRMQKLQSLETNLLQAHHDFKKRKNECLRSLCKKNFEKYSDVKKQCDNTEHFLHIYDQYEVKHGIQDYTSSEKEVSIINKNLDDLILKWKNTIYANN